LPEKYLRQVFETENIANIEIHGRVPSQSDEIRTGCAAIIRRGRKKKTVSARTAIAIDTTKRYPDGEREKVCRIGTVDSE
jgi:hypothetical protein